jgi:hypothetical protein
MSNLLLWNSVWRWTINVSTNPVPNIVYRLNYYERGNDAKIWYIQRNLYLPNKFFPKENAVTMNNTRYNINDDNDDIDNNNNK